MRARLNPRKVAFRLNEARKVVRQVALGKMRLPAGMRRIGAITRGKKIK